MKGLIHTVFGMSYFFTMNIGGGLKISARCVEIQAKGSTILQRQATIRLLRGEGKMDVQNCYM